MTECDLGSAVLPLALKCLYYQCMLEGHSQGCDTRQAPCQPKGDCFTTALCLNSVDSVKTSLRSSVIHEKHWLGTTVFCISDTQLNTESTWVPYADPSPPHPGSPHPFLDLFQGSGSLSLSKGDPSPYSSWVTGMGLTGWCATAVEISSAWQIQGPLGDPLRLG